MLKFNLTEIKIVFVVSNGWFKVLYLKISNQF